MNDKAAIPVMIGVTGHRGIRRQDEPAIRAAVKSELEKLQTLCPHSPLVMLSSLAEGGDLLCADVAEELGIPLIAALPRERTDYERDFSDEAKLRFSHHCSRSEEVFVTPPTEAVPDGGPGRDYQFRQAGIYVAAHSHILLALWDGGPGLCSEQKLHAGIRDAPSLGNRRSRDSYCHTKRGSNRRSGRDRTCAGELERGYGCVPKDRRLQPKCRRYSSGFRFPASFGGA